MTISEDLERIEVQGGDVSRRLALDAMAKALMPLVRLYLKAGLGAGEFVVAVKLAFIRVAAENARIGRRLNYSVISATTGLTRKEVKALLDLFKQDAEVPTRNISRQRTARVLHGWKTDPTFLDNLGSPALLPMSGLGASFAALVRRYGGDVTPMSVFKELERGGAVMRNNAGMVRLRKRSIRARGYSSETLAEVASRVHDLATTMVANIDKGDHHIYTGFHDVDNIPADVAALFHSIFSERAATLLDGVNRWIATQKKLRQPTGDSEQSTRAGIGVYLIAGPSAAEFPAKTPEAVQRPKASARRRKPPPHT